MSVDFYNIFYYSSLIIASLIGGLHFHKLSTPYQWLTILIVLTLASELIAKYIAFGIGRSNNEVYHFFTPIEYILYACIYSGFIQLKKWKPILWISAVGLVMLEIANTIFLQPLTVMNTNTIIVENLFLVFLSLILFHRIRETLFQRNLLLEGVFWFNSAVLCYYTYNIIISGLQSMKVYLLDNPPLVIYDFNLILSGLLYLTYSTSILLASSSKKQIMAQHD